MTKLRHAILENAKAFSVHETGFEHKIYRWLCFAKMRDLKVGRIKKEFKIVLFLSVIGNRDVWCVACLFAKLVFFEFHFVVDSDSIVASMDQMKWFPCCRVGIVEMLQMLSEVQNLVFVWRLGDTNKWTFVWKAKALSCVKDDIQQGTSDGLVFLL